MRTYEYVPGRGVVHVLALEAEQERPSTATTRPTVDADGTVWTSRAAHIELYRERRKAQALELARRERTLRALRRSRARWNPNDPRFQ